MVQEVRKTEQGRGSEKDRGEKEKDKQTRENRVWSLGRMRRLLFLAFIVTQKFAVAAVASDNIQNRERKMERLRWEKEMVRNSWAEQEDQRHLQEQGRRKSRSEMQKENVKKR